MKTQSYVAVVLSTQQEIINWIAIHEAGKQFTIERVDILQTSGAAAKPWAKNLSTVLRGENIPVEQIQLARLNAAEEYNPLALSQRIEAYYQNTPNVVWCWGGAQKPQATALFLAFSRRREAHPHDIAIYCEVGTIHQIDADGKTCQTRPELALTVQELATLYGAQQDTTKPPPSDLLKDEPSWEPGAPVADPDQSSPSIQEFKSTTTRNRVYGWPKGKQLMQSGHTCNEPASAFFEGAVFHRVWSFLRHNPAHIAADVKTNICFTDGTEFDVAIVTKRGTLIVLDAKLGSGDNKFRPQLQSVQKLGGSYAKLFYVVPWFPRYLDDQSLELQSGGTPPEQRMQKIVDAWERVDSDYGTAVWQGKRPPDDPSQPGFYESLYIPFDAGERFEERLRRLLIEG